MELENENDEYIDLNKAIKRLRKSKLTYFLIIFSLIICALDFSFSKKKYLLSFNYRFVSFGYLNKNNCVSSGINCYEGLSRIELTNVIDQDWKVEGSKVSKITYSQDTYKKELLYLREIEKKLVSKQLDFLIQYKQYLSDNNEKFKNFALEPISKFSIDYEIDQYQKGLKIIEFIESHNIVEQKNRNFVNYLIISFFISIILSVVINSFRKPEKKIV